MNRRRFLKTAVVAPIIGMLGFKLAANQTFIEHANDNLPEPAVMMFGNLRAHPGDVFHVPRTGENFMVRYMTKDGAVLERNLNKGKPQEIRPDDAIWHLGACQKEGT